MKIQKVVGLLSIVVLGTAMVSFARNSEKTISVTVKEPIVIGDVTLQRGKYEVREFNSGSQHFVEFSRLSWQDVATDAGDMGYVSEPTLVNEPVAQANATVEALDAPADRTELMASNNHAILKIRGEKEEYIF
jgi:hypothetical protein